MIGMKLTSPMQFTENHRFTVFRDCTLGPLEYKMMTGAYQPMIGAVAAGLYSLLLSQLPADQSGYSPLEQHRRLFRGLDIEPNDAGRKALIEAMSRLEAVGLMQSAQLEYVHTEEYLYEYRMFPPLTPVEFFGTAHLMLLLRDKIGEHALRALQVELVSETPDELEDPYLIRKELTSPFYEVYTLSRSAASSNAELSRQADDEATVSASVDRQLPKVRFSHAQIVGRIPKSSLNRQHVEQLAERQDIIERLNYYADKYGLTLKELGQLLDEDVMFDIHGDWVEREFEHTAEAYYMQRLKREEGVDWSLVEQLNQGKAESAASAQAAISPGAEEALQPAAIGIGFEVPAGLRERYDTASYNEMLRTEPYTKVLQLFVAPKIMGSTKELFSKLNVLYRFPDEVLNALIHHMRVNQLPWNTTYIEKVAASLQGQGVLNYEQATQYFQKELEGRKAREQKKQQAAGGTAGGTAGGKSSGSVRGRGGASAGTGSSGRKPKLPVYRPTQPGQPLTADEEAEFERLLRQLESADS